MQVNPVSNKSCTERVGTVGAISSTLITIQIIQQSACSGCHAKGACGSADSKEHQLQLPNKNQNLHVGDTVKIQMPSSMGLKAVLIAYVLPLVLMLICLVLANSLNIHQILSAIVALSVLALYYGFLYLQQNKLSKEFNFIIEKIE